jgi:hypothetical protein
MTSLQSKWANYFGKLDYVETKINNSISQKFWRRPNLHSGLHIPADKGRRGKDVGCATSLVIRQSHHVMQACKKKKEKKKKERKKRALISNI